MRANTAVRRIDFPKHTYSVNTSGFIIVQLPNTVSSDGANDILKGLLAHHNVKKQQRIEKVVPQAKQTTHKIT